MKISYLAAFLSCLILFSCNKSTENSTENLELTKKAPDFISTFPASALGLGSGMIEMYAGTVIENYLGAGEWSRRCDGETNNCVILVKVYDSGINKSPLNDGQRAELHGLCSNQNIDDIETYFNTGNGSTFLSPLADHAPIYWEGLKNGSMTIQLDGFDAESELSTIFITEVGQNLENIDITADNFYAFEI
jgi:hypothetical protein